MTNTNIRVKPGGLRTKMHPVPPTFECNIFESPEGPETFPGSVFVTYIYIYALYECKHIAQVRNRTQVGSWLTPTHVFVKKKRKITGTLFFRLRFFSISYCQYTRARARREGFEGAPGVVSYFFFLTPLLRAYSPFSLGYFFIFNAFLRFTPVSRAGG